MPALGYYTHFANLLDLCAVSVPSGFTPKGLPTGLMIVGAAGSDDAIASIASRFHHSQGLTVGATEVELPVGLDLPPLVMPAPESLVKLAVLGAQLSCQPFIHQMIDRKAASDQNLSNRGLLSVEGFGRHGSTKTRSGEGDRR